MGQDHPIAWTHETPEGGRFFSTRSSATTCAPLGTPLCQAAQSCKPILWGRPHDGLRGKKQK